MAHHDFDGLLSAVSDHADVDAAAAGAHDPILSSGQKDANLARLGRMKSPRVIRPFVVRRADRHGRRAVSGGGNRHTLVLVGQINLDPACEIPVEALQVRYERRTPRPHRPREKPAVDSLPLFRQLPDRAIDHVIGPRGLKLARDLFIRGLFEVRQQPAIDFGRDARGSLEAGRELVGELEQPRLPGAHGRGDDAVVPYEHHVRIFGQRLPTRFAWNAHPSPLPVATVVVVDEQIEDARPEKRAAVDAVVGTLQPPRP